MFLIVVLGVVSAFFPRRLCILNTYRSISHNATTRSNRPFCKRCFSLEYYEQTLQVTGCIWKPTACQDKHGLWSQEAERTQWLNIIYLWDKKKKVSFYWQDWHRLRKWADCLKSKHSLSKDDDQGNIFAKGPGFKRRISFPSKGLWFCSPITV